MTENVKNAKEPIYGEYMRKLAKGTLHSNMLNVPSMALGNEENASSSCINKR